MNFKEFIKILLFKERYGNKEEGIWTSSAWLWNRILLECCWSRFLLQLTMHLKKERDYIKNVLLTNKTPLGQIAPKLLSLSPHATRSWIDKVLFLSKSNFSLTGRIPSCAEREFIHFKWIILDFLVFAKSAQQSSTNLREVVRDTDNRSSCKLYVDKIETAL